MEEPAKHRVFCGGASVSRYECLNWALTEGLLAQVCKERGWCQTAIQAGQRGFRREAARLEPSAARVKDSARSTLCTVACRRAKSVSACLPRTIKQPQGPRCCTINSKKTLRTLNTSFRFLSREVPLDYRTGGVALRRYRRISVWYPMERPACPDCSGCSMNSNAHRHDVAPPHRIFQLPLSGPVR